MNFIIIQNIKMKNSLYLHMKMKNIQLFLYYIKKEIIFINLIYRLASSAYFSILNINITIFDEYTDVYQKETVLMMILIFYDLL